MRSTLIGGLVEVLQNNLNRKQNRVRIFEIARVFAKNADGGFAQNERIGGLWYGAAMPEQWGRKNAQRPIFTTSRPMWKTCSKAARLSL